MSEPLIATFMANSTIASVSFPIVLDDIEEPDETFDVSLMVPSRLAPSIQAGSPRLATATITDSTGIVNVNFKILLLQLHFSASKFEPIDVQG